MFIFILLIYFHIIKWGRLNNFFPTKNHILSNKVIYYYKIITYYITIFVINDQVNIGTPLNNMNEFVVKRLK